MSKSLHEMAASYPTPYFGWPFPAISSVSGWSPSFAIGELQFTITAMKTSHTMIPLSACLTAVLPSPTCQRNTLAGLVGQNSLHWSWVSTWIILMSAHFDMCSSMNSLRHKMSLPVPSLSLQTKPSLFNPIPPGAKLLWWPLGWKMTWLRIKQEKMHSLVQVQLKIIAYKNKVKV